MFRRSAAISTQRRAGWVDASAGAGMPRSAASSATRRGAGSSCARAAGRASSASAASRMGSRFDIRRLYPDIDEHLFRPARRGRRMIGGWWVFPLLGVAAGVLAGLLGIGGGLVLIGALFWLLPAYGIPQDAAMHAALASSLASIVLTASSSARAHHRRGSVLWPTVAWMVPGLLLGGWLGSLVAVALQGEVLRWCVAVYCFLVAAQMAFGGPRGDAAQPGVVPIGWPMSVAGGGIGAVSAVVGIGGGSMTVPLLV